MTPALNAKKLAESLAAVVAEKRKALGLTMSDVARASGLSQPMVSFVESGGRVPTVDTLARLAFVFNLPAWKLLQEAEKRGS